MPSRHPLSRLSFSWQIILLGMLVVILSLAVLFAIVATLRYTKSAVLKDEKEGLTQVARNLAQEFEDRAEVARTNHQPPLFGSSDSPASLDVLALLSRAVLQKSDTIAGGFCNSSTDSLLGQYFPGGERMLDDTGIGHGTGAAGDAVLSVARQAASTHEPADKVLLNPPGIVLIEAVPLREGYSVVGSAWSLKELPDVPGANRRSDIAPLAEHFLRIYSKKMPSPSSVSLTKPSSCFRTTPIPAMFASSKTWSSVLS